MPEIEVNGAHLKYTDEGNGAPIVFSHGLLMSGEMFRHQVDRLKGRYRCITYNHRGQAGSQVTGTGYDMDQLYKDAVALIEKLGASPCHFVGLSMGGFVGMRLAARRPDLIRSLTLLDTSAEPEPEANQPKYKLLNFIARWFGLKVVAGQVMPILFGRTFMTDPARKADRELWKQRITSHDRIGITRAVSGVIEREPIFGELGAISCPTLVAVGNEDKATIPAKSERIADAIPGAVLRIIPAAGHSSPVEQPDFVSDMLEEFLTSADANVG